MSERYPLEPDGDEFRRLAALATDRLAEFLDHLGEQPASCLEQAETYSQEVLQPMPIAGRSFEQVLEQLFTRTFPVAYHTSGPGYVAYIPGGGLPDSALADLISLITNRYVGLWTVAPVVAAIEATVIRWFCDLVGYGSSSGGFLTSGGSLANWSALVVAREIEMAADFRLGCVYTSDQAHHSVEKAAIMAGLDREWLRRVPVDEQQRVRVDWLRQQIRDDRAQGLLPLAIVAHAGTTNTGAVDDLDALADVAAEENLWLHVDAAYGGFFLLTDRGRDVLRGIHRADSVTLDPHKGLFLPYGTGCLLVREAAHLRQVFSMRGAYMTVKSHREEFVDFCDISPELSRDFRGLRVWLPLQLRGAAAFREALDEKLDLTRYAEQELARIPGLEIVARSPLSIVTFRLRRPEWSAAQTDQKNQELLERINARRRVLLSSTVLGGQFVIRICILSFRTHRDRIDECLAIIRQAAADC